VLERLEVTQRYSIIQAPHSLDYDPKSFRTLEEIPVSEVYSFDFFRRDAEEAPVLEYVSLHSERYSNDVADVADVFSRVVHYGRVFSEYLSLDDFASVDKYFTGNKTNVFGFTDDDVRLVGKGLSDDFVAQSAANLGWIKRVLASENYAPATDEMGWEFRKPHVQHEVDADSYTSLHSGRGLSSGTSHVSNIDSIDTVKGLDDPAPTESILSRDVTKEFRTLPSAEWLRHEWVPTPGGFTFISIPHFGREEVTADTGSSAYFDHQTGKMVFINKDPSKWLSRTVLPDATDSVEVSEDSCSVVPNIQRWNEFNLNHWDPTQYAFAVEKLIFDYITLDDFSTIEKHVETKPYLDANGQKTNYAFITSQLGFDISRSMSEDSTSIISDEVLELSKGLASDATPTVDQSFIVDKKADDQAALFEEIDTEFTGGHSSDTPLTDYWFDKDTAKGISDHLNMHHYWNVFGWHFERDVDNTYETRTVSSNSFTGNTWYGPWYTVNPDSVEFTDEVTTIFDYGRVSDDPIVLEENFSYISYRTLSESFDDDVMLVTNQTFTSESATTDTQGTSDEFLYQIYHTLSHTQDDSSDATDELVHELKKPFFEGLPPTSTLVRVASKGLSDSTEPTSALVRVASKGLSDSTNHTSTLVRATEIGLADEAPVTESITVELISTAVVASRTLGGTTFNSNTLN
jgi:hypothetical protein